MSDMPAVVYAVMVPVWWLMWIAGVTVYWRHRDDEDRIMHVADILSRKFFMSPERCARALPSLIVVVGGAVSVGVVPVWWVSLSGDSLDSAVIDPQWDVTMLAVVIVALGGILGGLVLAGTTAIWRWPAALVFPFLREVESLEPIMRDS